MKNLKRPWNFAAFITSIAVLVCLLLSNSAQASQPWGRYAVTVTRKDSDVYVDRSGAVILTRYCYEYVYGDNAILIWNGPYGSSKIVFSGGATCEVKDVL